VRNRKILIKTHIGICFFGGETLAELQSYEKNDIFGKIMKNGAFFVFTACSESL
jgi:hypothetical protein